MAARQYVGAEAPGPVTPDRGDDARELGSGAGTRGESTERSGNSAARALAMVDPAATLRARLAIAGWTLIESAGSEYMVARWGMARCLGNLDEVERFAAQVGAPT